MLELDYQRRVRDSQETSSRAIQDAAAAEAKAQHAVASAKLQEQEHKDKMNASKAQFADLSISSQLFDELKRMSPDVLTLRQFVQLRVHELVVPLQQQIELLRREVDAKDAAVLDFKAEKERDMRQYIHDAAVARSNEAVARDLCADLQRSTASLQSRLAAALNQVDSLHSKGASFDAIDKKRRELEVQAARDAHTIASHAAQIESLRSERDAASSKASGLQQRVEALVSERSTLAAALEESRSRYRLLEDEVSHLSSSLRETARQRDTYSEQLQRINVDARSAAEDRVGSEVMRMREERQLELAEVKSSHRELYERESKALREAKNEALAESARLQSRLDSLTAMHEESVRALTQRLSSAEAQQSDTRSQLTIRTYDNEQLSILHAQAQDELSKLKAELQLVTDKLCLVQQEYSRLEAGSERIKNSLEARLESERLRLQQYDSMEQRVDEAVLAAASGVGGNADEEGGLASTGDIASALSSAMRAPLAVTGGTGDLDGGPGAAVSAAINTLQSLGLTTSALRRLEQAVSLARDLMAARKDVQTMQQRNDSLARLLEEARREGDSMRQQLDAVDGPQEYFIRMLKQREAELRSSQAESAELRAQLSHARQAAIEMAAARERLDGEIRILKEKSAVSEALASNLRRMLESGLAVIPSSGSNSQQPAGGSPDRGGVPPLAPQHTHAANAFAVPADVHGARIPATSAAAASTTGGAFGKASIMLSQSISQKQRAASSTGIDAAAATGSQSALAGGSTRASEPFSAETPFEHGIYFENPENYGGIAAVSAVSLPGAGGLGMHTVHGPRRPSMSTSRGSGRSSPAAMPHFPAVTSVDSLLPGGEAGPLFAPLVADISVRPLMLNVASRSPAEGEVEDHGASTAERHARQQQPAAQTPLPKWYKRTRPAGGSASASTRSGFSNYYGTASSLPDSHVAVDSSVLQFQSYS